MATIGADVITLRDFLQGRTKEGLVDKDVVELLVKMNPMLDDMNIIQANDGSVNKTTIRTGMPKTAWVGYYEGSFPSKGAKAQIRDVAGHMESLLEMDEREFNDQKDKDAFLADEVASHMAQMGNDMQETLIYGNVRKEPRKFNGLQNWYSVPGAESTNYDDKDAAHYVFDGYASKSGTALRSIYLVGWSPRTITGFYPENHKNAGLSKGSLDSVWEHDDKGGRYKILRQPFYWDLGLTVKDFRYGGRIANIEMDKMLDKSNTTDYVELVRRLINRVKADGVRQNLYMCKDLWSNIEVLFARATQGNAVQYKDLEQRKTPELLGIPVRICDAMDVTEEKITL